ncbi:MAG: hypothetical protein QXT19_00835 [Candidatus Woesearchaeota archaeon]
MKKAQLTLTIIMGVILLLAAVTVIWLGTQTATLQTEPEAGEQRLRQVAVQPVREYIQSCLDITTMAGLELLGKQGGVLYKMQGGLTPDVQPMEEGSRYVEYEGINVSYVITRPVQDIGTLYYAEPDEYPFPSFPYVFNQTTGSVIKEFYGGYYGKSLLPPLFKPGKDSIQEQLESYIRFNLPKCTDWKTFAAQGLSITAGRPDVSVMIAENITQIEAEQFLTVLVKWQVNITDLTTNRNTTLDQFSLSYPVHLAKFYLFVQGIVLGEISDATFDPRNVSTTATPVTIIKNVYKNSFDQGTDDIILVRDEESRLRGKPLEFWILRANRYPALVWINQTELDRHEFYSLGTCKQKPSIFLAGDLLEIKFPDIWTARLRAVDPDEDIVAFRTEPASPGQITMPPPGEPFRMRVYASDGGKTEDYQVLKLRVTGCPD